jgi:hypothetical protein
LPAKSAIDNDNDYELDRNYLFYWVEKLGASAYLKKAMTNE